MSLLNWFRRQIAVRPPMESPAAIGPTDFESAAHLVAKEMVALLAERHRKYGPANIARHGERGAVVRMGDKLSRLERAYGLTPTCWKCGAPYGGDMEPLGDGEFTDESLEDAWLDGGNYPLVALMVRRGWWHLPLLGHSEPPPAEPDYLEPPAPVHPMEPRYEEFPPGFLLPFLILVAVVIIAAFIYMVLA